MDPPRDSDADPNLVLHLNTDPNPVFQSHSDADSAFRSLIAMMRLRIRIFTLMRIQIRIPKMMRIRIRNTAQYEVTVNRCAMASLERWAISKYPVVKIVWEQPSSIIDWYQITYPTPIFYPGKKIFLHVANLWYFF